MAISLTDLPYDADGAVPGTWRVELSSELDHCAAGANFIRGVAVDVAGRVMPRLAATMGHEIARIVRTDIVERPLIAEPAKPAPKAEPKPKAAPKPDRASLEAMKKADLFEVAEKLGLDVHFQATKADIIRAILGAA